MQVISALQMVLMGVVNWIAIQAGNGASRKRK